VPGLKFYEENIFAPFLTSQHSELYIEKYRKKAPPATPEEIKSALFLRKDVEALEKKSPEIKAKELLPCQKDKLKVREIVEKVSAEYSVLTIPQLEGLPAVQEIIKAYNDKGLFRRWVTEKPSVITGSKRGRISQEIKDQQAKICKELGIKIK